MAANMQWDVYRDASGNVPVKMLYNEKETDFQAALRWRPFCCRAAILTAMRS